MESIIIAGVLVLIAILVVFSTIKIVPQARAGIVERLGRYNRTLDAGLTLIIPFVDRLRPHLEVAVELGRSSAAAAAAVRASSCTRLPVPA